MSNTDAQLRAASPLSILTCVLFAAAITKGLNIVMEIKLGFFVALFCWCWISAVSQHLHLHFLRVSEVEGAAGLNATALCGTHNSAARKEGQEVQLTQQITSQAWRRSQSSILVLFVGVNV